MKKQTKTSMKYFRSFGIALLVIGISIGAYGIFRAPSSDASQLENELMQNERELEKEEAAPMLPQRHLPPPKSRLPLHGFLIFMNPPSQ